MTLVYGDSLCSGIKFSTPYHVEKYPGCTSEELLHNVFGLEFLLQEDNYNKVIIIAGSNDFAHNYSYEETAKNILCMHEICWKKNIKTILTGTRNKDFNKVLLEKFFGKPDFIYCGFLEAYEEIHLNEDEKVLFSEALEVLLQQIQVNIISSRK